MRTVRSMDSSRATRARLAVPICGWCCSAQCENEDCKRAGTPEFAPGDTSAKAIEMQKTRARLLARQELEALGDRGPVERVLLPYTGQHDFRTPEQMTNADFAASMMAFQSVRLYSPKRVTRFMCR